jgi:hypothetical protein
MATTTDLTKNTVSTTDQTSQDTSGMVHEDSNVNVFEFGNLLLAGLLPTIISVINFLADYDGSLVSASDITESTVSAEDESVATVSLSDSGGETTTGTDYTESSQTIEDFSGETLSGTDVSVSVMTISDTSGSNGTWVDKSVDNSTTYDFADYTYDQVNINYDGYPIQGVVVDIAGS